MSLQIGAKGFIVDSGEDALITLGSTAGANTLSIADLGGTPRVVIDDVGNITTVGTVDGVDIAIWNTALKTFTGQSSNADSSPTYSSTNIITDGDSLETAAGKLDAAASRWDEIASSKYTQLTPSVGTITMSDTSDMRVGLPVKYTISASDFYGIVKTVTTNTSIVVAGDGLGSGVTVTNLFVGLPEMVVNMTFMLTGNFNISDTTTALATIMKTYAEWRLDTAFLVTFYAIQESPDTGSVESTVNILIAGSAVSTENTNDGPFLSATAATWVQNSNQEINNANYGISFDDALEIEITNDTGGDTNGDAEDLTIDLIFVMEN